jgi:hypothetical protein
MDERVDPLEDDDSRAVVLAYRLNLETTRLLQPLPHNV